MSNGRYVLLALDEMANRDIYDRSYKVKNLLSRMGYTSIATCLVSANTDTLEELGDTISALSTCETLVVFTGYEKSRFIRTLVDVAIHYDIDTHLFSTRDMVLLDVDRQTT